MKKLIFIASLILLTGFAFGQTFQKGNLIGTHVMTVTLQPGVTMDQFMEFYNKKVVAEMNKFDPNWKVYLVKSIRGERVNSFGTFHIIKSEKDRDKYFNVDGSMNEAGNKLMEKINPVMEELKKYGTYTTIYVDWLVQ